MTALFFGLCMVFQSRSECLFQTVLWGRPSMASVRRRPLRADRFRLDGAPSEDSNRNSERL